MNALQPETIAVLSALMDGRERTTFDVVHKTGMPMSSVRARLSGLVRTGHVDVDRLADEMVPVYRAKPTLLAKFDAFRATDKLVAEVAARS